MGKTSRVRSHRRTTTSADGKKRVSQVRSHDRTNPSGTSTSVASQGTKQLKVSTFTLADQADTPEPSPEEVLRFRAKKLAVDISSFQSTASDNDDVSWSSNDWCFNRDGIIEAADIVVTRDGPRGPEILCIRRSHPPFASTWALPGGLRDQGETLQVAADRELEEETGIRSGSLGSGRWLGELHATDWDPRSVGAHVGAAHYHTDGTVQAVAGDDAVDARWIPVEDIATGKEVLAFGHSHWVASAFRDNPVYSERLDVVSEAARYRNRRIIDQVNERRRAAQSTRPELQLIPTSSDSGPWKSTGN